MAEEKEETIVQDAFVTDPKTGRVTKTRKTITPEKGIGEAEKKKEDTVSYSGSAEGVFLNPEGAPTPMDKELARIEEKRAHRRRGKLLKEMEKSGPGKGKTSDKKRK